ncbi:phosphodiester glycosidase family protein [Oceanobacillus damuensis]|uniref:phosphodiester glycosidase family protein n=1 Tax=Oceanobacillus damuensis TaxID=937928 RepID=UPI000835DF30|nr:phosphodiester glycosidase family protein [Oceanobacillus damuensis]
MNRKWWMTMVLIFIFSLLAIMPVYADNEPNPIADSRSASSDRTEPEITVGPDGRTLLSEEDTITIGPGIELTSFERFDIRGWLNGEIMTIDLSNENVSTDLLFPGVITKAMRVSEMAQASGAVGAVNGDFFDINNTKAPSGTMIKDGDLLKSPQGSHTLTAGVDEQGKGQIANIFLEGTIKLPAGEYTLSALNQSSIPSSGIGLYTSVWGQAQRPASGSSLYEVTVQEGEVVGVSEEPGSGEIPENTFVLVGREQGAANLKELSIGDEVSVEYAPKMDEDTLMNFAVGGNVKLVENGQVPATIDDSTTAPRTAVGFSEDGNTMILGLVDGRQSDSRGMTYKELGELMKEYGAYTALNIDGGGSSTMVARKPGYENAEVINEPSDGVERSVPNGIGIYAEAGSGELTDFSVETVSDTENSDRIFPGLSRSFTGIGYDENYSPVEVGEISWQALPADVGSFDEDGVFYAKKTGTAVAEAQIKSAKGTKEITVLGELERIASSNSYLGLEMGRNSSFSVTGYDSKGYSAPIEALDIELEYDDSVVAIEEKHDGSFTVVPVEDGASTTISVTVLDKEVSIPVTVGLTSVNIADFEDTTGWGVTKYPSSVGASMEVVEGREGNGIQVNYDFSTTTATRAAYLQTSPRLELPGDVQKIGLWVHGDGNGAWLRTVISDATGTNYTLTLANQVDWTGWKYVETSLPEGISYPAKLWRIYPVETNSNKQYTGQLIFDDITVEVPPSVEMINEEAPASADPLIIQNDSIGNDRWKFAVLTDSQFVAASPNSNQVEMARESLRQIVAEDPEFLVINGDFVDTAWEEDFEFAKQILEEEVGDEIPVYYIPGNHEIAGSGNLDNFLDVFEENRYSFDHNGTRFILLDTSTGSLRTSDFDQMIELKESLDDAASDPAIKNVTVIGHHPTRDPLPTDNSQLSDRKEAELLEKWLTEFREESNGKGAIYLSGHAHTVHLERVEGVPYMVTGPAGKAPYGAKDNGGFYAWTLFGIDPTAVPNKAIGPDRAAEQSNVKGSEWIQAEVLPLLESVTLHAPETVTIGETISIDATGHQAGNLDFPLRYPASVTWEGSDNVYVGSGDTAEQAEKSGSYAAIFNPADGKLKPLKAEEITLKVTSNNVSDEQQITIQ